MSHIQVMFDPKITPYPTKYTTPWQLSDGTEVLLRAIRPEDEPAEHEMLIGIARERGLEDIRADVLIENERMLNVFRRLGFTTHWVPGGTSEAVLKLKEQGTPGRMNKRSS